MRLCFDATRFGFGLIESVRLAKQKGLEAIEYTFEPFQDASKSTRSLSAQEKDYLKEVRAECRNLAVEIAALKLNYPLRPSDSQGRRRFAATVEKLGNVAAALDCQRILIYLDPEPDEVWTDKVEQVLTPLSAKLERKGVRLTLSLSTPPCYRGKSLRHWRSIEPQEWRHLLASHPELSLSFSPADCAWQGIDYLKILSGIVQAVEHVEAQDIEVNRSLLADSGLFGPLWWRYRIPGKGQIDWRQLLETLKLFEFKGNLSIHLDDEFTGEDPEELSEALDSSKRLLQPLARY